MYTLFTHCAYTVHILKNIKNESHDTIYIFKNYFATVFSATISSIQTHPKTPNMLWHEKIWGQFNFLCWFFKNFHSYSSNIILKKSIYTKGVFGRLVLTHFYTFQHTFLSTCISKTPKQHTQTNQPNKPLIIKTRA